MIHVSDLVGAMILEGFTYPIIVRVLSRLPSGDDYDCLPPSSLETCPPLERYVETDCEALAPTLPSMGNPPT